MTEEAQVHPAMRRFTGWADPRSRLLLVRAAPGTGRIWFARSWIGDRRGTVHDFSSKEFEGLAELETISRELSQDPELHAAVVLSPEHTVWHLALTAKILFAQQRDLLLNAGEISAMLGGIAGSEEEALEIYGKCGGWLGAVKLLVRDPHSVEPARQTLRGALSMWLAHSDPGKELSEAAILPVFDDATVEIFYSHLHADPHTVNDLVHCGLLQENAEQDWMMPSMVRELLLERVQLAGAQRMELLEAAALEAATSVHGVLATAEAALEQRRWSVLNRLVTEKWDELLLLDLQKFMKLASRIPPAITGKNTYFGLGLRILGEFMRNDSGLQAPRLAMDYANNPLAQALRHETDRLYLNPDPQAVTIGLMEMLYLRMNGMYAEAGESALRMRSALHKASDASTGNPSLAALVHAQAGSSLFLAGRGAEAQQSYELSLDSARRTGNAFLLADPAGKLALLHALEGNADAARDYLSEHEQHISRVGWGQAMVERDAILARTCLALRMLDAELARSELSKLSRTPDMDEFWPVHAYLLAAEKFILGLPAAAGKLVHQMSRQRVVSAKSPLAQGLLGDILAAVALAEYSYLPEGVDRSTIDPALLALKHLSDGNPDAALAELRNDQLSTGLRVGSNLARYVEIAARSNEGPTSEQVAAIERLHADSGGLYEIAMLKLIPGWGEIGNLLEFTPESDRRSTGWAGVPQPGMTVRPTLTPREREVLRHLREGKSRKEIAAEIFRSENTIKTQIKSLYRKLEANNLEQMLLRARTLGL